MMQFIYVYGGCSPKKYKEYVEEKGIRVQQQSQKYNQLLMEGLCANGMKVSAISSRPINSAVSTRLFYKGEKDSENGIDYYYVPFISKRVLRKVSVFFGVFFKMLFMHVEKERIMICDALNIAASAGAYLACKIRGIKTCGIVTDVPCHRPDNSKIPLHEKINLFLMKKFDMYLFLTEQMSSIVNPKNRPYVVLEGHADVSMEKVENSLCGKYDKKVCLYAGTLRKVYGIESLVKGFINAGIPDTELHIYGNGDYVEDMKELSKQYDNVKYLGIASNNEIVAAELRATLLVNPRPTHEEYTKYSFPSKNMEYMASGTPVLTTRLPGMPKDHEEYVFFIDDETEKGIEIALKNVFANTDEQLHAFGARAKNFVLKNKNNKIQAHRVIDFMRNHLELEA